MTNVIELELRSIDFIEKLKRFIKEEQVFADNPTTGFMANLVDADDILKMIEEFEQENK